MNALAPPGHERDHLLVALNCTTDLPRASACRLAALHERWLHADCWPLLPPDLEVPLAHARAALALSASAAATAATERARAKEQGARVISLLDPDYPRRFLDLALPPPALYLRGALPDAPAVAIVGARRASPYGLEIARWFARELARQGVTIVSGFAYGVDAAAHRAALEVDAGRSVAVLGCGLNVDYPRGHRALGAGICERGALLTEFPCERSPAPWQFPVRNRLIAALADACLVVEAAPRSGSLVTARWALELGREVLAVPGRLIDELALGTNRLIADGARPALEPADVLEALTLPTTPGLSARAARGLIEPPSALTGERRALWLSARDEPAAPEALAARTGIAIERALSTLLELELGGYLRRAPGGTYEPLR